MRSLQLLCTVGGDLASPRTVAKYFFARGGGRAQSCSRAQDCNPKLYLPNLFNIYKLGSNTLPIAN